MSEKVFCERHGNIAHDENSECVWPCYVAPPGVLRSMTAAETLDPREAI